MATPLPYDLIRELEEAAEELAELVPVNDPAYRLIAVARLVVVEARGGAPPSEP